MNVEEMGRCLTRLKVVLTQWAPKEIDRDTCLIWANVLKDFSDEDIRSAFLKAAGTLAEWPAPAIIKRLCMGSNQSDAEIGQDVATRIEGAIGKFGYASEPFAQEFIGPMGWEVVRQCGGWRTVCDVQYDQLPSYRKQWRELATIISKNFYTEGKNLPPGIPTGKSNPALKAALKLINNNGT